MIQIPIPVNYISYHLKVHLKSVCYFTLRINDGKQLIEFYSMKRKAWTQTLYQWDEGWNHWEGWWSRSEILGHWHCPPSSDICKVWILRYVLHVYSYLYSPIQSMPWLSRAATNSSSYFPSPYLDRGDPGQSESVIRKHEY